MELSNDKKIEYMKRLLKSRMRILVNNGFYGLLLMHMVYTLDERCETAATDGKRIYFSPDFLEELSDPELDFIMMHEILHVVLQHCLRQGECDNEIFNQACDIVVNSNILLSENMNNQSITLRKYGVSIHLAPNGKEGYEYTAEQVYGMLQVALGGNSGGEKNSKNLLGDKSGAGKSNVGKSDVRKSGENPLDGKVGTCGMGRNDSGSMPNGQWDEHTYWGTEAENEILKDIWRKRFEEAYEAMEMRKASKQRGTIPLFAERLFKELRNAQTDWRKILNEFVQQEIVDYSFTPPDRRFDDNPFFLPDFNEKDDRPEDILFMIDTSGSMSDEMITAAYSEVKGAIDQFDGRLKGWLGFFDAEVIEPKSFESEDELRVIKPKGGGGTSFKVIFNYVYENMQDKMPVCIIILTDGYAPFHDESIAMGIPVLWLLNNQNVTPTWGKVARIEI